MKKQKVESDKALDSKWEDILEEIDIKYLPIEYVKTIILKFEDNTTWEINLVDSRKTQTDEKIEEMLDDLFDEYNSDITDYNYQLDMQKIKRYLSKRVGYFLKHNK